MPGNAPNQSVQRAVRVLYAVAGSEDGRTVAQIATAVGLRPHTAYKFIRTLEAENFISRREAPLRFVLGRAVSELKRLDDDRKLLTLSERILVRAQASLPTASLVLLEPEGTDTYQRLGVFRHRPGVVVKRRDFIVDPYAKVSSLLFLAHASPLVFTRFFRDHPFEDNGRKIWKTRAHLDAFLDQIRRLGYALPDFPDDADTPTPLFRVAAPVFGPDGSLVAAVAGFMSDDASNRSKKLLVGLCRKAASSVALGLK